MADKGKLVSTPAHLSTPETVKGTDFKSTAGKQGLAEGKGKLVDFPDAVRHAEDGGSCAHPVPAPTDRGAIVARNFKEQKSSAESGTAVKMSLDVDLETGMHTNSLK